MGEFSSMLGQRSKLQSLQVESSSGKTEHNDLKQRIATEAQQVSIAFYFAVGD
jgi:hypothetical protein